MDTLCHAALVCCILSALAGLVRTFWPQNGFKPVINAVLTLYIITSVLHAVSGLNWQNFDAQLQNFASQSAPGEDYTAYGAELAMQESAAALQKLLRQSGIESVVQPQAGGVHVRLVYPADREQAETLLQNFTGDLPYNTGEHPMTAKQSIAWLQAAWKDDKKRINLLLVSGLAGMLLLCMSEWLPAGQSAQNAAQSSQQSQTAAEYEQQLETRLAALIRAMDGAGETVVMVTLDCGEETTYAADTRTEKTSEDTRSSAASQRTHLLAGAQPVVQSVQAPQVRGVAVLCQGGGNAGTQRRITELVSALTGVGASHITVNKMQS